MLLNSNYEKYYLPRGIVIYVLMSTPNLGDVHDADQSKS